MYFICPTCGVGANLDCGVLVDDDCLVRQRSRFGGIDIARDDYFNERFFVVWFLSTKTATNLSSRIRRRVFSSCLISAATHSFERSSTCCFASGDGTFEFFGSADSDNTATQQVIITKKSLSSRFRVSSLEAYPMIDPPNAERHAFA
jgi:hypothetical protein